MQSHCKLRSLSSKGVTCSTVLLLLLLGFPQSFSQPTYLWKDLHTGERLECQQCRPGTYMSRHCTRERETDCKPCPDLHYTEYWNYLEGCLYCNVFCNFLEEEAQPCNRTQNRVCRCKPGYHSEQDFCIKHSNCPPGSGVVQLGDPYQDTKCKACPRGTFSSNSSLDPCKLHQSCSAQGLELNVRGNQFHDALCTTCKLKAANGTTDGLDDWLKSEECQNALIDFVPYNMKSARRLQRLNRLFSRRPHLARNVKKSPEELQAELHAGLVMLKEKEGKLQVAEKLRAALRCNVPQQTCNKIQKHFFS